MQARVWKVLVAIDSLSTVSMQSAQGSAFAWELCMDAVEGHDSPLLTDSLEWNLESLRILLSEEIFKQL